MKRINIEKLPELYAKIAQDFSLYLPIDKEDCVDFAQYSPDANVRLDVLKTSKSPKDLFFPQSETLYSCQSAKGKITIEPNCPNTDKFVIFGMKNCDFKGVEILDRVFLSNPVDTYYNARRENGVIVTLACNAPSESCFCKAYGIDCAEGMGDISAWLYEGYLYWRPNTEKGEALCEITDSLFEDCDENAVEDLKQNIRNIVDKLPLMQLALDGWGKDKTEEKFNSPLWEELYKPCLACGTCTFVCPTCQCYDIKDYNTGNGVMRYRCWDSCMYSDFTMMAHGNNRTSQMQRFRQRFMHKLVYFPDNNDGIFSCTGCGRCIEKCPSSLNIAKVIKAFQKEA